MLRLLPPLILTAEQADRGLGALEQVLAELGDEAG
jgi:4-aminobutyrate aminotransferase-like enzyme